VLVLLPPSEGKTPPPADGAPLDLTRLVAPGLRPTRERVLDALVEASARPDARELLEVGATVADEVARNVTLRSAPTREARHVYSGVLYAAAGADRLEGAALERAERHVRTVSALWGLVAPTDPIPAYRLSMQASLPGLGPLARAWRAPLARELDGRAELVVDCRSSAYLAAWRPPAHVAWVTVRVVREGKVVSHAAKHARGVLVGHLCRREGPPPESPGALLEVARELVGTAILDARSVPGPGAQHRLELEVAA